MLNEIIGLGICRVSNDVNLGAARSRLLRIVGTSTVQSCADCSRD
jgi:hypothetical protein